MTPAPTSAEALADKIADLAWDWPTSPTAVLRDRDGFVAAVARLLAAREGGGYWTVVTDDPATWPKAGHPFTCDILVEYGGEVARLRGGNKRFDCAAQVRMMCESSAEIRAGILRWRHWPASPGGGEGW